LENEHPVGYFIINDENAKKFEDNIKQFLKPDVFQENANAIKNPGLRYGRLIAEKLFPNYSVEKVEEEKWDRIPELKGKSYILKDDDVAALDSFLPPQWRNRDWGLLFCTSTDGVSMSTFYNKTRELQPTLLLCQDMNGGVFGAYLSESWVKQKGFYGTGETFLFKLRPTNQRSTWRWTEKNNYFMYSTEDEIAVGGGEGRYGLRIGREWTEGQSEPCLTFSNPPLSSTPSFEVQCVEVWQFL